MLHLRQLQTARPWRGVTLWQPKPKVTHNEVSSKMTPLTPSICTRAFVLLCQSWPPPRAPLSGGRSWKPSPVSGLHGWTMGKDKPLKPRPPRQQDRIIAGDVDFSISSLLTVCVRVCVCWRVCVRVSQFDFLNEKKNTEGNTARERRGQKKEGLNDEVTWREVRSFQMGLHTHTSFIVPDATQPTQYRAGYCCTMQSFHYVVSSLLS